MADKKKKQSINFQYYLRSRRYLFIAGVFVGLSLILVLLVISPKVNSIRSLLNDRQEQVEELNILNNKEKILNTVEELDVYKDRERIHAIFPSSKPVLAILKQIERLSAENQVIVTEFSVTPGKISTESATEVSRSSRNDAPKSSDSMEIVETEAVVIGKIDNVNSFLRGITSITPFTKTTSLTLKSVNRAGAAAVSQEASGEAIVFEAGVSLASYFFTKELAATQPNTALPDLRMTDALRQSITEFTIPEGDASAQQFSPTQIEGGGKENLFQ